MITENSILTFIRDFGAGGTERVTVALAGEWTRQGRHVTIVSGTNDGLIRSQLDDSVALLASAVPLSAGLRGEFELARAVAAAARLAKPATIFVPGNSYTLCACLIKLILGRDCPPIIANISNTLLLHRHRPLLHHGYKAWLKLQTCFIDCYVGISAATAAEMRATTGISAQRTPVIPLPLLPPRGVTAPDTIGNHARPYILAVGRLVLQKDFATLITAFGKLADRWPGDLVILGEGPLRASLTEQVAQQKLTNRVLLPGHQSDPARWMRGAQLLVLSSRFEGLPAVVLEALNIGLPVIATDCSSSLHYLRAEKLLPPLVPPGNPAVLSAALMNQLATLPLPLEKQQALKDGMRAHRLDLSAARYLKLFDACANTRPMLMSRA